MGAGGRAFKSPRPDQLNQKDAGYFWGQPNDCRQICSCGAPQVAPPVGANRVTYLQVRVGNPGQRPLAAHRCIGLEVPRSVDRGWNPGERPPNFLERLLCPVFDRRTAGYAVYGMLLSVAGQVRRRIYIERPAKHGSQPDLPAPIDRQLMLFGRPGLCRWKAPGI